MRQKKKWIVISVIVAAVVLVGGILGGAAYAQTPEAGNSGNTLLGKVAAILGIEQQELEDAFAQAQKEMRLENQKAYLDKLVEAGRITQEQADEYQSWLEARPDVPVGLDAYPGVRMGPMGPGFGMGPMGPGGGMGIRGGFHCFPRDRANMPSPSATPGTR